MKNYELLDMIGEVNGDYVIAADSNVVRPRWKPWAAAACAALALCAYPIYQAATTPKGLGQNAMPPLHSYTVVEDSGDALFETTGGARAAAGGAESFSAPAPEASIAMGGDYAVGSNRADEEAVNDEIRNARPGEHCGDPAMSEIGEAAPAGDSGQENAAPDRGEELTPAPVPEPAPALTVDQNSAIMQYQRLYNACGLEDNPPEWYAGAWLDNDYPDNTARLAVSIVAGYHTPELEAQIQEWCRGEVVFVQDMKYAYAQLESMLDQVNGALADPAQREDWDTFSFMGADIMNNRLEVSFSGLPSDAALAFLAQLDPEGDAILVQAFTGRVNTFTDELPSAEESPEPAAHYDLLPGGAQIGTDDALPEPTPVSEEAVPAVISLPPENR